MAYITQLTIAGGTLRTAKVYKPSQNVLQADVYFGIDNENGPEYTYSAGVRCEDEIFAMARYLVEDIDGWVPTNSDISEMAALLRRLCP